MEKVYVIVKIGEGPGGHGMSGAPLISLMHDGILFTLGVPCPIFKEKEMAEEYRKINDECGFYHVMEIDLI